MLGSWIITGAIHLETKSGCSAAGSARALGAWGRRFESFHPDFSWDKNQEFTYKINYLYVFILSLKNMLFMGIVISNSLIGIIQECKVKSLIDKLSVITATKARKLAAGWKSGYRKNKFWYTAVKGSIKGNNYYR